MATRDVPFTVELEEEASELPVEGEGDEPGRSGDRQGAGEGPPVLTVAQLTRQIRGLLEEQFPIVLVQGELSNVKRAASGHVYFALKDDDAQVRCVMFRGAAQSLRFRPEDGLAVTVRGRVSVYEVRGEYQIQVLMLEPQGQGALQLAFEQLKQRLQAEGLFDAARKRPLPLLPRRVGIVTSAQGAAIRDILHVLERRFPSLPVLLYPVAVQGERAAGEIVEGIETLNRLAEEQRIDVLIVGRGGGSVEDLWAFNEEPVARAIHASQVPVVSAVGHEVDFTIADFVADVRAPTPSAAAELVAPSRVELLRTVRSWREQLLRRTRDQLVRRLERWEYLRSRLVSPEAALQQHAQRVDDLAERLRNAGRGHAERQGERLRQAREALLLMRPDRFNRMYRTSVRQLERALAPALRRHVRGQRERFAAHAELLHSLSPLTVMQRGYAAVQDEQGSLMRTSGELEPGQLLRLRMADGRADARVETVTPDPDGVATGATGSGADDAAPDGGS